jgi:hypothetical protein
MAPSPDRVTTDLLGQLERFLDEQRRSSVGLLPPPVDEQGLRERAAQLEIDVSDDAVAWWTWHDGSGEEILPGWGHISFEQALDEYRYRRTHAVAHAASPGSSVPDPNRWWHPNWFSVGNSGTATSLIIDGSSLDRDRVPIRTVDWSGIGDTDYPQFVACSMASLIRGLLRVCEEGRYIYSPDQSAWQPADGVWRPLPAIIGESWAINGQ